MYREKDLLEAEVFRQKHDLHPAIPLEEISELMSLAELGLLPKICPNCANGECAANWCYGQGCECTCEEATMFREQGPEAVHAKRRGEYEKYLEAAHQKALERMREQHYDWRANT